MSFLRNTGLCVGAAVLALSWAQAQVASPPPFAFPVAPPGTPPPATTDEVAHLPGSSASFTLKQVRNGFDVADWHPGDHPPMPDYVKHGAAPNVRACGYCHLPNGQGRPENASIAGQPSDYIVEQVVAMREGRRKSSEPRMGPPAAMLALSAHTKDSDLKIAGDYFASLTYKPWIRVVESDTAPKTFVDGTSMLNPTPDGATEKLGNRIIEIPESVERTELRDPRSGFIAYVPKGSIARGQKLVESGAGTMPCATCHGADYKGAGGTPGLAGRSPSYLIRQMYDIQHGTRSGPKVEPMKFVVAKMKLSDMVAIAAYLSSRKP